MLSMDCDSLGRRVWMPFRANSPQPERAPRPTEGRSRFSITPNRCRFGAKGRQMSAADNIFAHLTRQVGAIWVLPPSPFGCHGTVSPQKPPVGTVLGTYFWHPLNKSRACITLCIAHSVRVAGISSVVPHRASTKTPLSHCSGHRCRVTGLACAGVSHDAGDASFQVGQRLTGACGSV